MSGEIELEETGNPNDSHPLLHHNVTASNEIDIENDDVEAGSIVTCRICLECDGDEDDDLISPCTCKGTQQFVHRACLDHWRSVKEGFAFSHCTTCKAQFHLQFVELKHSSWRTIRFRLFVARDVFLVFLAVQTVIGLLGGLAYIADKHRTFRTSFDDRLNRILSKTDPLPFYYSIGVFVFFVLVGFIGLILHCLSCNNDPRVAGCQNCCFGLAMLDCFPASVEACLVLVVVFVVIFLILGIAYGFFAGTMVIQRIWQRHYHILTKKRTYPGICGEGSSWTLHPSKLGSCT